MPFRHSHSSTPASAFLFLFLLISVSPFWGQERQLLRLHIVVSTVTWSGNSRDIIRFIVCHALIHGVSPLSNCIWLSCSPSTVEQLFTYILIHFIKVLAVFVYLIIFLSSSCKVYISIELTWHGGIGKGHRLGWYVQASEFCCSLPSLLKLGSPEKMLFWCDSLEGSLFYVLEGHEHAGSLDVIHLGVVAEQGVRLYEISLVVGDRDGSSPPTTPVGTGVLLLLGRQEYLRVEVIFTSCLLFVELI